MTRESDETLESLTASRQPETRENVVYGPHYHSAPARAASRELHDNVGQAIAAGLQRMDLAERYDGDGNTILAQAKRDEARHIFRQTLAVIKRLAVQLRTSLYVESATLEPGSYCADWAVTKNRHEDIFCILREAVDNALKHSAAEHITIHLSAAPEQFAAFVADDGCGLPADWAESPLSLGLHSMRERASLLGGTLQIAPASPTGTEVIIRVPMPRRES